MDAPFARLALSLCLFLSLSACDSDFDDTEENAEIYARLKVFSNGDQNPALLLVDLREGGGDGSSRAELGDNDQVLASQGQSIGELIGSEGDVFDTVGGLSDAVSELPLEGRTFFRPYQVELTSPGRVAHGRLFRDFDRNARFYVYLWRDNRDSVGDSWATLPPSFELATPAQGQTLSRSGNIDLSWTNPGSGDLMRLLVRGDCDDGSSVSETIDLGADDGAESIPASAYDGDIAGGAATCNLRLIVRRIDRGYINSGYGRGGLFEGIEQRWVDITSTP